MTTQHTPTPWLIEYDPEEHKPPEFSCVDITVGPPTGHTIAHVDPHNEMPQHADANAAYIVLACNAHEELAEIAQLVSDLATDSYCEWCCEHAPKNDRTGKIIGPLSHVDDCIVKQARAALAQAKGETT